MAASEAEAGRLCGPDRGQGRVSKESRALGQGTVRTQDRERQEPLLESWVTGAQLTQWQRTVLQGQETTKPARRSPTPVETLKLSWTQRGARLWEKWPWPRPGSSAQLARGVWEGPERGRTRSPGSSGNQSLLGLPVRVSSKEGERSSSSFSQGTMRKRTLQLQPDPYNRSGNPGNSQMGTGVSER